MDHRIHLSPLPQIRLDHGCHHSRNRCFTMGLMGQAGQGCVLALPETQPKFDTRIGLSHVPCPYGWEKVPLLFGLVRWGAIRFKTIWFKKCLSWIPTLRQDFQEQFQLTLFRLSGLRVAQRFSASRKLVQQGTNPFTKGHGIGPK